MTILGYKNFADYQTELRMAKSGEKVKHFLGDLEEKTRPFFTTEQAALKAVAPKLRGWDVAYYTQKTPAAEIRVQSGRASAIFRT